MKKRPRNKFTDVSPFVGTETDYNHKLSTEQREWLNRFDREENGRMNHRGKKPLNSKTKQKKIHQSRYKRKSDITSNFVRVDEQAIDITEMPVETTSSTVFDHLTSGLLPNTYYIHVTDTQIEFFKTNYFGVPKDKETYPLKDRYSTSGIIRLEPEEYTKLLYKFKGLQRI